MEKLAPYVMQNRRYIVSVIRHMTTEQLNLVPRGFSNSIIWNIGHMTASLLEMFYLMTGHGITVEEKYHTGFRIGTHPFWVDQDEVIKIKHLYLESVGQLDQDYYSGFFEEYEASVRMDQSMLSLTDLSNHFLFHEGLHFNNIMTLRRIILLDQGQFSR